MGRIAVADHLTRDEIAHRYRARPGGAETSRWQVLWLVTRPGEPLPAGRAALAVGLTAAAPTGPRRS